MTKKEREEIREEFGKDCLDLVSDWVHEKILYKLHTVWLWLGIAFMFVIEHAMNWLIIADPILLAADEYVIGSIIAVFVNELRHRRKLNKQLAADKENKIEATDPRVHDA